MHHYTPVGVIEWRGTNYSSDTEILIRMKKRNDFEKEGREKGRAGSDSTGRRSRGENAGREFNRGARAGSRERIQGDRKNYDNAERPQRNASPSGGRFNDDRAPRGDREGGRFSRDANFGDRSERSTRRDSGDGEKRFGGDREARGERGGSRFSRDSNFGDRNSSERSPRRVDGDNRFGGDREARGERGGSRFSRDSNFGDRNSSERSPRRESRDGEKRFGGDREARGEHGGSRFSRDSNFGDRSGDERSPRRVDGDNRFGGDREARGERGGSKFSRDSNFGDRNSSERSPRRESGDRDKRFGSDREARGERGGSRFSRDSNFGDRNGGERSSRKSGDRDDRRASDAGRDYAGRSRPRYDDKRNVRSSEENDAPEKDGSIRLNRFIANAGICSRREADELIESGQITVNGKVVDEMGFKVKSSDIVKYGKRVLNAEKLVYILLNKPKDFITTTEDPEDRRTVLDLIEGACEERVYPVGRLDRNTTGLLLITNDGELADKLTHPSYNTKKIYQAELDKAITLEDFEKLKEGVELEDGFIKPDDVGIVTPDAFVVGIEIHSGKNRIVRRMFESLGYEVKKLDRTTFAGLNKKDLPRGKWRFLSPKEVIALKYLT
jgi:23S rRNA pseudouridine2605 synthase